MTNLALAYEYAGQLEQAVPLFEQSLTAFRATMRADHPKALATQRNLAIAYEKAQRNRDAERLIRELIAVSARTNPHNDRFDSESLAYFGRYLIHQHKDDEAICVLRRCLEIKEKSSPTTGPRPEPAACWVRRWPGRRPIPRLSDCSYAPDSSR